MFYAAIGRVTPEAMTAAERKMIFLWFIEGVDYDVQYDEQTKVLQGCLSKTNKTFNVIFLVAMSHDNPRVRIHSQSKL